MNIKLLFIFLAVAASVFSACAATPKESAERKPIPNSKDCVFFRTLYDWRTLDDHNMVIWAPSTRDAYHLYFMTPLVGLNFSMRLGFVDRDHDGLLCGFSRDEIVMPDNGFPQRASITSMEHLDANGIAKLEEQYKVKLTRDSKKKKPTEPERDTAQ